MRSARRFLIRGWYDWRGDLAPGLRAKNLVVGLVLLAQDTVGGLLLIERDLSLFVVRAVRGASDFLLNRWNGSGRGGWCRSCMAELFCRLRRGIRGRGGQYDLRAMRTADVPSEQLRPNSHPTAAERTRECMGWRRHRDWSWRRYGRETGGEGGEGYSTGRALETRRADCIRNPCPSRPVFGELAGVGAPPPPGPRARTEGGWGLPRHWFLARPLGVASPGSSPVAHFNPPKRCFWNFSSFQTFSSWPNDV
jgi:hypothetical protein